MKLRRADTCVSCGAALAVGTVAYWDSKAKTVTCLTCRGETMPASEAPAPEDVPAAPPELERRHLHRLAHGGEVGRVVGDLGPERQVDRNDRELVLLLAGADPEQPSHHRK